MIMPVIKVSYRNESGRQVYKTNDCEHFHSFCVFGAFFLSENVRGQYLIN